MKIVYDNIIFSLQKMGGISIYWRELCKRIVEHADVIFYEQPNDNLASQDLDIKRARECKRTPAWILRIVPFKKQLASGTIFHSSYYRISRKPGVKNVVTVHDFTNEYFGAGWKSKMHTWMKKRALYFADAVICVSESTKRDLQSFFPWVDESIVTVVHNGVSENYTPLENAEAELARVFPKLQPGFVLFVGSQVGYKNFAMAEAASNAVNKKLVAVGTGSEYGHMNEADLNILYNNAHCLVYPSEYEGFGIPVIEAMRAGCPVIATNRSSIPEVAGDAGLLMDVPSVDAITERIKQIDTMQDDLTQKGFTQAEKFSWDKCFTETFEVYNAISNT